MVLLRTCAVGVINPDSKKSTLACAQLDTASQATLISERLCNELGSKRTLGDFTTRCNEHSDFDLASLDDGKTYGIKRALIVSYFADDDNTLPHRINTSKLCHFRARGTSTSHFLS